MGLHYLWGCFVLFLIPGFILAKKNIEIHTTIHARYAVTTVIAEYMTGNSSENVGFEMELNPEAIISDFSFTADELWCHASLVDIEHVFERSVSQAFSEADGIFLHKNSKFETSKEIEIKDNTQVSFFLKFEHPVLKNDKDNTFNFKIPVKTSQFYSHWSVKVDIKEDHRINRIKPYMEMYHNGEDISNSFTQNKRNVQNEDLTNNEIILFKGTLTAPDNSNSSNNYEGYFSVDYTTNPEEKQIEIYLSETQIGAVISQNTVLHPVRNSDIVVLIDSSGSMDWDNKLVNAIDAIIETLLIEDGGLTEGDQVTFLKFDRRVENLGTFSGSKTDKDKAMKILRNIKAYGGTDINWAILNALIVTETHIGGGSSDIPLIALFTDGEDSNSNKIAENIRDNNRRCIPIDSFAVGGNDEDKKLLYNISTLNCGKLTTLRDTTTLKKDLGSFLEKVRVPVYSIDHKISIHSDCVNMDMISNDITALSGRKFTNTDIELINIPFNDKINLDQPCEVDLIYSSTVANKIVVELLKICFHQGKNEYEKFTDFSLKCPETIQTPIEIHKKENFIENLREYREKAKGGVKDSIRKVGFVTCEVV